TSSPRAKRKRQGQYRGKLGYPQPKAKKKGLGSFRLTGAITVSPAAIWLPRLGPLRLKEQGYLPPTSPGLAGVKVLSATVSEHAGGWYVSVQVEQDQAGPGRTSQQRAGGWRRLGQEIVGHALGWDGHCQPQAPQAAAEEDQTLAAGGLAQ